MEGQSTNGDFVCTECGIKIGRSKVQLARHLRKCRLPVTLPSLLCHICGSQIRGNQWNLKRHLKRHSEAVGLINIASGTPTYASPTWPARQSVEGLRSSVLDRSRPNSYVSPTSSVNYESENQEEFGDSVGYNEDLERAAVLSAGLDYSHVPWDSESDFGDLIEINKDHLINISEKGAVLVHGDSPQRAAYVAVLMAAVQYDLSFDWSLQRLWELGHGISATEDADIYDVYRKYLLPNAD